ncbi:MAG TPA: CHAD domain-containing protein [Steroidobacteraceae bacterium]|nr:CHAD domain-containing protein [Steroidobacteraceae bacterium]
MAYELNRNEPGTLAARHILRQQVRRALQALARRELSDAAVHSARKDLKKARATLRLLRPALGDTTYKRENAALRDAARPLSLARDSTALLAQLDKLIDRYGTTARELALDTLRQELRREHRAARRKLRQREMLTPHLAALQGVHDRSVRWRVGRHGWTILGAGLKGVYASGRGALGVARGKRSPENLHEWRKHVKYLWHQLQLLTPLWPGLLGELADQAHQLADYLGDDHDLAVLRVKVLERRDLFPDLATRRGLLALVDQCRTELEDKAVVLGERIFEEKPQAFAARLGQYWSGWHRVRS